MWGRYLAFTLVTTATIVSFATKQEDEKGLVLVDHEEETADDSGLNIFVDSDSDEVNEVNYEPFNPTHEWKVIKPGQSIPRGLHVRINLQTGLKEAKFLDGSEDTGRYKLGNKNDGIKPTPEVDTQQNVIKDILILEDGKKEENNGVKSQDNKHRVKTEARMRAEIIKALKNVKSEDGKTPEELSAETEKNKKIFRSYSQLKEEFAKLNLKVETDAEILHRLLKEYKEADGNDLKRLDILEDFEYLLHQIDNAVTFVDIGGLKSIILPGLNETSIEIRKCVLKILGSAVQSNPKVQIAAVEADLVTHLLRIVALDPETSLCNTAVYALSCLVRGFPYGQQLLIRNGGFDVLRNIFHRDDWRSLPVQLRIVSLIQDLLVERVGAEGERANQLAEIDLQGSLVNGGWCSAVSSLLAAASFDRRGIRQDLGAALSPGLPLRPDHDTVDKVVSAMGSLVASCQHQFGPVLPLLRSLAKTYEDLAYKEQFQGDDGHELFHDMALQISTLVQLIPGKDEL